ncbi:MAG: hypothetical protein GY774_37190 [Planctomycetes bacterium]|nr:hypothetical protein [Planctomycetota bacterium]
MIRAINITMRTIPHRAPPMTLDMLEVLCKICDRMGVVGLVVKLALQLGFYAFMRASNLAPPSAKSYDKTRHFLRRDVSVNKGNMTIKLKWSKSLQAAGQPRIIPVPRSRNNNLDALQTFQRVKQEVTAAPDDPLFTLPDGTWLTIDQLRKVFQLLLRKAGYADKRLTIHSLRRGGATQCYARGAKELDIQRQGAWASTSYLNYIDSQDAHASSVCGALQ